MKFFSYLNEESIKEGFDAGMVFPSFKSAPKYGEDLVTIANSSTGVLVTVIRFTNKVPNYIAKRTFTAKSEIRKRSSYEGLSGIPIKSFIIPNIAFNFVEGGKVRNEDKPLIDAAIKRAA